MSLFQEMQDFEDKLNGLLEEAKQLRLHIEDLERQNIILQEQLLKDKYQSGGFEALGRLYDESYHICHAHFAEIREEDCLFCLSLLHHEGVQTE